MEVTKNPVVQILLGVVILLVGAALGGMYVKIQYLEGKGGSVAGSNAAAAPSAPAAPSAAAPSAPPAAPTAVNIAISPNDPVLGNPNAKVTVVEFADYQCPFCERFFTDTFSQIKKDYIDTGKIKFVYKNLAFLGKESTDAANAALCAKDQNKFWEYHDYLFTHQGPENSGAFSPDKLKGFAASLGLDTTQFNSCLDNQKDNAQVTADQTEANKNGFNSTPSLAVGTTPIIGAQPYSQFQTAIDSELAKAK